MFLELSLFKRVILNFKGQTFQERENSIWWGFPIFDTDVVEYETIQDYNSVSGYFCHVHYNENQVTITTDITGGYRVYYYESRELLYFTDDYQLLLDQLKADNNLSIDTTQLEFWKNHRYTFGDRTFVEQIRKIPPYTTIKIDKNKVEKESYFQPCVEAYKNSNRHKVIVEKTISTIFKNFKGCTQPIILLFSGGSDSVYLANRLKDLNIKFQAVFFRLYPELKSNYYDWLRANEVAKKMDITLLTIDIDLDLNKEEMIPVITSEMLFDRHFSLIHYIGFKELANKFPLDSIIINGQGSDSILSFGPSEEGIGSLIKRILLYYPYSINWLLKKALEHRTKKTFSFPLNNLDRLKAFCDERNYIFLLSQNEAEYDKSIEDYVLSVTDNMSDSTLLTKQMSIKLNTFLQGSDNQVAIKSARYFGFNKVVLPFCSPDIIYATMRHKNSLKELLCPKYVLKNKRDTIAACDNVVVGDKIFVPLLDLEYSVYAFFDKKIESLDDLFFKA